MKVTITETRYGHAQLAALVEMNTAIILIMVGFGVGIISDPVAATLPILCAVICLIESSAIISRGVAYRAKDRFIGTNEWTLDDLDDDNIQEMRTRGHTHIEVE